MTDHAISGSESHDCEERSSSADTIRRESAAESEMAQQLSVYPNWPLITHAQLNGWYESHRALRAERDSLRAERQQAIDERDAANRTAAENAARIEELRTRCEQAIDALREIAHTLSCSSPLVTQDIARAALLSLREQP